MRGIGLEIFSSAQWKSEAKGGFSPARKFNNVAVVLAIIGITGTILFAIAYARPNVGALSSLYHSAGGRAALIVTSSLTGVLVLAIPTLCVAELRRERRKQFSILTGIGADGRPRVDAT